MQERADQTKKQLRDRVESKMSMGLGGLGGMSAMDIDPSFSHMSSSSELGRSSRGKGKARSRGMMGGGGSRHK